MTHVRARFAPSPSGYLHIGGARTALFNYLFARHHGGTFVLRVEDTDRERSTQESIQAILDGMTWLGLNWDEGPYFQSQRQALHMEHAERLLGEGKAYRCYCSAAELEAKRELATKAGHTPMYDRTCRNRSGGKEGSPFVVRFKAPLDGETVVPDLVKGHVTFRNRDFDDLILVRSDGTPVYNFSAVVDDATMGITHILRGEDHLANTPKQIQLYRALGFDPPAFAHIPLILGLDRTRLSKRHGATSVLAYRDMGYLPDAVVNYLARLAWSHGDQEIFSRAELIEKFGLDHVGTSAGIYNAEKAEWVNAQHLKALAPEALAAALRPFLAARGYDADNLDDAWLARVGKSLQDRAKTLVELVDQAKYFLEDTIEFDNAATAKHWKPALLDPLRALRTELGNAASWDHDTLHACFQVVQERFSINLGKLAQPMRVALTGGTVSPGIFDVLEILGAQRSLARLDAAIATIAAAPTMASPAGPE